MCVAAPGLTAKALLVPLTPLLSVTLIVCAVAATVNVSANKPTPLFQVNAPDVADASGTAVVTL